MQTPNHMTSAVAWAVVLAGCADPPRMADTRPVTTAIKGIDIRRPKPFVWDFEFRDAAQAQAVGERIYRAMLHGPPPTPFPLRYRQYMDQLARASANTKPCLEWRGARRRGKDKLIVLVDTVLVRNK